jgi:hypothetical protein
VQNTIRVTLGILVDLQWHIKQVYVGDSRASYVSLRLAYALPRTCLTPNALCVCPCHLLFQDTEWFESKRLKRGGRGGGRGGGRSGGRGSGSTGSFHASSSRGGLGGNSGQLSAAAAVGTFSGGTFTSGVYSALEDLEGGLEEEGLAVQPLLSPKAVAAVVPLNPVLEELGELEPEEEAAKGKGFVCLQAMAAHMPQVSARVLRAQLRCTTTWPRCEAGLQNTTLEGRRSKHASAVAFQVACADRLMSLSCCHLQAPP